MNRALEFHDSEVESIVAEGQRVTVRFSDAYIHGSTGTPGVSPGDGFLQAAELVFSDTQASFPPHSHGTLSEGTIRVGEDTYTLLPLPFQAHGDVTADLLFTSGTRVRIAGRSVQCSLVGEPRWLEKYEG